MVAEKTTAQAGFSYGFMHQTIINPRDNSQNLTFAVLKAVFLQIQGWRRRDSDGEAGDGETAIELGALLLGDGRRQECNNNEGRVSSTIDIEGRSKGGRRRWAMVEVGGGRWRRRSIILVGCCFRF